VTAEEKAPVVRCSTVTHALAFIGGRWAYRTAR
jgi:hypothetical protein